MKTARIIAIPCMGVNAPLSHLKYELDCSTDLPDEAVGEAVGRAVAAAWETGIDPAIAPFCVLITFDGVK